MDAIYGRSVRTIVWLGNDDDDDDDDNDNNEGDGARDAFALAESINVICERELSVPDLPSWPSYEAAGHVKIHEHGLPRHTDPQWSLLSRLLSRPWFSRLWTLQEVVLSPQDPIALCGTAACSFDAIARSVHWLVYKGFVVYNVLPQPALNVSKICQLRLDQCQKSLDLLCYMTLGGGGGGGGFNTTDPRDKVYGLLGIARSDPEWRALGMNIAVDYSSSTEQVYRSLVRALISAKKSTGMLSLKMARCALLGEAWWQLGREGDWASLSSWTVGLDGPTALRYGPELLVSRSLRNLDAVAEELIARTALPQASKALPAEIGDQSGDAALLSLKGLFVDRVAYVCNSCYSTVWNLPLATRLQYYFNQAAGQYRNAVGWKKRAYYFVKSLLISAQEPSISDLWKVATRLGAYKTEEALAQAFLYCTTGGLSADQQQTLDAGDMRDSMLAFVRQQASSVKTEIAYSEYVYAAFKHMANLQFFVTERGHIGTGSPQIRVGDEVCVLFGGEVPYLVRRSGSGSGSGSESEWLFVGSSFIYELAQGQAVDAWQAGELEAQFITLR